MRRWLSWSLAPLTLLVLAAIVTLSLALWVDTESNPANAIGTDTLAAPTGLGLVAAGGNNTLTWTPTSSTWAGGYTVQRSLTSGSGYSFLATVPGQASNGYVDAVGSGGFETVTFMSVTSLVQTTASTSMVITKPAGTVLNDLLIATVSTQNDTTISPPAGWTQLGQLTEQNDVTMGVWYRVAGGSEPASYTFTWDSSRESNGAILRYDGADPVAPIDVSAITSNETSSPLAPSVTTTVSNAVVLRLFGSEGEVLESPVGDTYPGATTGRYAIETSCACSVSVSSAGADAAQATAGASGTASFSITDSEQWVAATVALTPNYVPPSTYYYVVNAYFQNWTSPNSNEASGSGGGGFIVARLGAWGTGTSHTAPAGTDRALVFVAGAEGSAGLPDLTSVTYGGQALTQIVQDNAGASTFDAAEIWVLSEAGIAAASGSTFIVNWTNSPDNLSYAHAFYSDVNQASLTGATAINNSDAATPNPITTASLATANGDMVVTGVISGNPGSYTAGNGFTLAVSTSFDSTATLGAAEKRATGAAETPSMQHSGPNRQAIGGIVLQATP